MDNEQNMNRRSQRREKKSSISKITIITSVILIVILLGAGMGFLTASIHTMPNLKGDIRPVASSQIYDTNGKLVATIHSVENRIPVTINKIPKDLQNAFVAAEDARFYNHIGVDPRGILRALWSNIMDRGVSEGGSTITQQLAKNALLSQERTLKRKIQEAFLALQIERQYSKNEILELYLNQIYFGQGAYGVQSAAQVYFKKNVEDLTLAECAMLAGIPKSPNYYSPLNNLKAATERQATVLDQMVKYEYITSAMSTAAQSEKLKFASSYSKNGFASYFVDYITQQLIEKYGADSVYKDGLRVYTTLDIDMQRAAEEAMQKLPAERTDNKGIKQPQGALVALDPHNGFIKAMVGGRGNDQFNRAVLAERQPGSAFKPFVYLAGIEAGMNPTTKIDDSQITFGTWSPANYDSKFHGRVTMRAALEQSLNIPAVKIAQQAGIDKVLYFAQQMGISTTVMQGPTNDRNLATALGGLSRGVIPLEIASAYGVLANQGIRVEPVAITKVVDRNGKLIEQYTPREKAVISEKSAYILTDMLRGVMTNGTGTAANINRPSAGKTGTTSDYKDAWFIGYTPDLVAAVWLGYDTDGLLNGVTGGSIPADIWRSFMTEAVAKIPVRDFIVPSGFTMSATDSDSQDLIDTSKKVKSDPKPPAKSNNNDKKPVKPDKSDPPDKSDTPVTAPAPPNTKPETKKITP